MSLKAGRVGVAPDQVDEFGKIKSEATSGYTKQEADAKFETKINASTEYAKLQPKTLSVPISMLQGSLLVPKTTVESVIQTMDNAMTNRELTEKVAKSTETFGLVDAYRNNGVVMLKFTGNSITETDGMTIGTLSEKYRPIVEFRAMTKIYNGSSYVDVHVNISASGVVKLMNTNGQAIANIQPKYTLLTPVFIPSID